MIITEPLWLVTTDCTELLISAEHMDQAASEAEAEGHCVLAVEAACVDAYPRDIALALHHHVAKEF